MWADNETNRDFLNFRCVADSAAEVIVQADGQPLSMGVSGGWGVGKSSMLSFIADSLKAREDGRYLFVEFNAWLYQGYDDARAALLEVIAKRLLEHGEKSKTGLDSAKELLKRVNWLRLAGLTVGSALSVAAGLPPVGLIGTAWSAGRKLMAGEIEPEEVETAERAGGALGEGIGALLALAPDSTPPRQIHDLRRHFATTLTEMGVTLVVCVDDLDRCLPSTAIATLEAIRLFLFMPQTAFVVAADDRMIRQAVRVHFRADDLDEDLVTNYFDKLIQVPLRVPPLGTQEVRAYLMMLFIEDSELDSETAERLREEVCRRLSESWRGRRVDSRFVLELIGECPPTLRRNLELADRLAPLMTTAKQIAGNPRLIKRFLNTIAIRLSIARAQEVAVDEGALAKMLLFERCGGGDAYAELLSAVSDGDEGKPVFLREWERKARAGEELADLPSTWATPFIKDWLALPPAFGDTDLRPVVYVSREHMPIIASTDQLSSEAAGLLEALVGLSRPSAQLAELLQGLAGREVAVILDRLLVQARQVQEWGTPGVLWGLITVVRAMPDTASNVAGLFEGVPAGRLQPDIVPALAGLEWARGVLERWRGDRRTSERVKRAIEKSVRPVGGDSTRKRVN